MDLMDFARDIFTNFASPGMLLFSLIIWILVLIQRKVVESVVPKFKESHYWNELFLPLGPIGTGIILAGLLKTYPFPTVWGTGLAVRLGEGAICGLASGYVYRIVKKTIFAKLGIQEKEKPNEEETSLLDGEK